MVDSKGKRGMYLTFDRDFYKKLKEKAKTEGFFSVQQFIYELLRRNLYHSTKFGRPRRAKESVYHLLGRKQIFAKHGGSAIKA